MIGLALQSAPTDWWCLCWIPEPADPSVHNGPFPYPGEMGVTESGITPPLGIPFDVSVFMLWRHCRQDISSASNPPI